jgi:hypothetical protein
VGMRGFLKKGKGDLDAVRSVFLNIDEVGRGTVRFASREGLLLPIKAHAQLLEICEEMVEEREEEAEDDEGDEDDDDGDDRPELRSMVSRTTSDGYAARSAGFPAITITCKGSLDYTTGHHQRSDTPENIDDEALERAYEFTSELIERLNEKVGPDLDSPADETLLKEES